MVVRTFKHDAENRDAVLRGAGRLHARSQHRHRLETSAAGAEEPAVERLQVHVAGRRASERDGGRRRVDARIIPCSARPGAWSRSRSRIPASASRPRSSASSSRRSSRPTRARAASTAAPASDWPSAANCQRCSAARFSCAARRASARRSRCTCRSATPVRRSRRGGEEAAASAGQSALPRDAVRLPIHACRERADRRVADDRDDLHPDDAVAAHRRRRSALRAYPGRSGTRQGTQGAGRHARQRGAEVSRVSSGRWRCRSTCSCPTCSGGRC